MLPETEQIQKTLADYCRTGEQEDNLPGVTPDRLHQYRRLVNNVIYSALEQAYPITKDLLSDEQWNTLVDDFFIHHDCKTPQIWKMPYEFYEYVVESDYATKLQKPYIADLLYFEWMEIEVYCMENIATKTYEKSGNLKTQTLVFNPEYRLIQLEYPVHKPDLDIEQQSKSIYHVLIHRDAEESNVHFMDLGYFPAIFLSHLLEGKLFDDALSLTAAIFKIEVSKKEEQFLEQFLLTLRDKQFFLGYAY